MNSPLARYAAMGRDPDPNGEFKIARPFAFTEIGRGVTAATGGAGAKVVVTCAANFPEIGRPPPEAASGATFLPASSPRKIHANSGD